MKHFALLIALIPASAMAEQPMTATAFDTYATGKTITYGPIDGDIYGQEQYLPNRRVIWQPIGGDCVTGVWFESKGNICFRYNNNPQAKCWQFYEHPDGLRATFMNRPGTDNLYQLNTTPDPILCPGPPLSS